MFCVSTTYIDNIKGLHKRKTHSTNAKLLIYNFTLILVKLRG